MKEAVREIKRLKQEVFMPLIHRPVQDEADFGYALVKVSAVLGKVAFFDGATVLGCLFRNGLLA